MLESIDPHTLTSGQLFDSSRIRNKTINTFSDGTPPTISQCPWFLVPLTGLPTTVITDVVFQTTSWREGVVFIRGYLVPLLVKSCTLKGMSPYVRT